MIHWNIFILQIKLTEKLHKIKVCAQIRHTASAESNDKNYLYEVKINRRKPVVILRHQIEKITQIRHF